MNMESLKTITNLVPQQRKEDRLNVYLDGAFAFGLHASIAADLGVGQQLSPEECEELQSRDVEYRAYERALRFLSYRPRSRAEVERHLQSKGLADSAVAQVAARLQEEGWLSDPGFAEFWVDNREEFRPRSRWAMSQELRQKGVSDQVIEKALQGIDEADSAYRAAEGRAQRLARLDYQTFRRRLGGFLQRRGFGYDVIKDVVERLWRECASNREDARSS